MDAAAQGSTALAEKDFAGAISHYTKAISANPHAVDYYIKRSTAYTRISPSNHVSALSDAETAVVLAHKRGKRELIAQAQLRRGIALFGLERWGDASQCFGWVKKLLPGEKTLGIWEAKLTKKMEVVSMDDERRVVGIQEIPDVNTEDLVKATKGTANKTKAPGQTVESKSTEAPQPQPTSGGVQTPASKIRYDWYQSTESVTVTLMAKGVPKDKTAVEIQPHSLTVSFPLLTGSDYDLSLDPLFAEIDPSASTYKIMGTKVEFILQKAHPGSKWSSLEGTGPVSSSDPTSISNSDDPVKRAVLGPPSTSTTPSAPAYPTSSKSGPKNWDKLADDLTKKKPAKASKPKSTKIPTESPIGSHDASEPEDNGNGIDDDDDGGDPAHAFFKQIFKNADPDTKRAMMKSYQESNGTALSTNWEEVGKGKVETQPPEGMVAKKWGE